MIVNRSLLYSLFISIPTFLSPVFAQDTTPQPPKAEQAKEITKTSLDQLRQKCMDLREDTQRKAFSIKINCAGSYTMWTGTAGQVTLPNSGQISAQTSTKMGRFETNRKTFSSEIPESTASCKAWTQIKISSPDGIGIPVDITECDELTPENVGILCEGVVYDYCENNAEQNSASQ